MLQVVLTISLFLLRLVLEYVITRDLEYHEVWVLVKIVIVRLQHLCHRPRVLAEKLAYEFIFVIYRYWCLISRMLLPCGFLFLPQKFLVIVVTLPFKLF